jgi:hypothetical protein
MNLLLIKLLKMSFYIKLTSDIMHDQLNFRIFDFIVRFNNESDIDEFISLIEFSNENTSFIKYNSFARKYIDNYDNANEKIKNILQPKPNGITTKNNSIIVYKSIIDTISLLNDICLSNIQTNEFFILKMYESSFNRELEPLLFEVKAYDSSIKHYKSLIIGKEEYDIKFNQALKATPENVNLLVKDGTRYMLLSLVDLEFYSLTLLSEFIYK